MQRKSTQHEVPQSLERRHPYIASEHKYTFSSVQPHEVRHAYGRRGMTKLVELIRFDEATEQELQEALSILFHSLGSQEKAQYVIQEELVDGLTRRLLHTSSDIRIKSLMVLFRLCNYHSCHSKLVESGTINILQQLCSPDETVQTVRYTAALTMARIARERQGTELILDQADILESLTKSFETCSTLIHVFVYLTSHFQEGAERFTRAGGVPTLIQLVAEIHQDWRTTQPSSSTKSSTANSVNRWQYKLATEQFDVLEDALLTIRSTASDDEGKFQIVDQQAIPLLVSFYKHSSTCVRIAVSGTLPLLAAVELTSLQAFHACGFYGIETVAAALADSSNSVYKNTCTAIRHLSANSVTKQRFVFEFLRTNQVKFLVDVFGANACVELGRCLVFDGIARIRENAIYGVKILAQREDGIHALANALHLLVRLISAITSVYDGKTLPFVGTSFPNYVQTTGFTLEEHNEALLHAMKSDKDLSTFTATYNAEIVEEGLQALELLCSTFEDCRETVQSVLANKHLAMTDSSCSSQATQDNLDRLKKLLDVKPTLAQILNKK